MLRVPENRPTSSPGARGVEFERGRRAFQHRLPPGFDRHAEARDSLSASIRRSTRRCHPGIDRSAHTPDDRCRTWPACEPNAYWNQVRPADLAFFTVRALLFAREHAVSGLQTQGSADLEERQLRTTCIADTPPHQINPAFTVVN